MQLPRGSGVDAKQELSRCHYLNLDRGSAHGFCPFPRFAGWKSPYKEANISAVLFAK